MAKKTKENRKHIVLECSEQRKMGIPGISRYTTTKNRKNCPDRLKLMKFNPFLKKYTLHVEVK